MSKFPGMPVRISSNIYLKYLSGGLRDEGRDVNLTGFCNTGHEGIACDSCAAGYAKFGSNNTPFSLI